MKIQFFKNLNRNNTLILKKNENITLVINVKYDK